MKKHLIALVVSALGCGVAHGEMPKMNATDHVYGYHLREVYKDMEKLKNSYDDTKLKGDVHELYNQLNNLNDRSNVLDDSIANIISSINDTSNRIDGMANSTDDTINTINNNMGVIKHDMESMQHSINSLESSTNQLSNTVNNLHHDVSNIRNDVNTLKHDTAKGLAQANALSSLKYLGGKGLQISIGTGGYRGTSAIAYGVFYGINDDLMIYAGGTDNSYNASVNVRIGGK